MIFCRVLDAEMKDATRAGVTLENKKEEGAATSFPGSLFSASTVLEKKTLV